MQDRGAVGAKALWGRLASVSSAAFAAACCLGMPAALAALGVFGATFLLTDAFLIPMLALSLMLSSEEYLVQLVSHVGCLLELSLR